MRYAIIIAVMLGIVAAFVLTRRPALSGQTAALPNGMRVEYLGAAVGGATFSAEKPWHKMARRFLPGSLSNWIPTSPSGSCSSGTNSVTLFFRVTDPSGTPINGAPWQQYQASDDDGFHYNPDGGYCSFGAASNTVLFGLTLQAYPRRQEAFNLSLFGSKRSMLAAFRIPNPGQRTFQEWSPGALPQTQTNGPVVLTLASLRSRSGGWWNNIDPEWRIESTNTLWANAKTERTTLLDATGNEGPMLSPREPAWKVRTFVHRQREQDFGEEDRLVLTNIAIPKPGTFLETDQSVEKNGVTLRLLAVAGPGKLIVSNRTHLAMPAVSGPQSGHSTSESGNESIETWAHTQHFILLQAGHPEPDDEIRFFVADNAGRKVELKDAGYYGKTGLRQYQRAFTPEADATTLNISVAVSRPRKFEFTIHPQPLQTDRK